MDGEEDSGPCLDVARGPSVAQDTSNKAKAQATRPRFTISAYRAQLLGYTCDGRLAVLGGADAAAKERARALLQQPMPCAAQTDNGACRSPHLNYELTMTATLGSPIYRPTDCTRRRPAPLRIARRTTGALTRSSPCQRLDKTVGSEGWTAQTVPAPPILCRAHQKGHGAWPTRVRYRRADQVHRRL